MSTLPTTTLDAIFPTTIRVGALTLNPLTLLHLAALDRLDCPVLSGAALVPATSLEALFVCALPVEALAKYMAGDFADLRLAAALFGLRIPAGEAVGALNAVTTQINAAFDPVVAGDDGSDPTPATPPTSAGSSK